MKQLLIKQLLLVSSIAVLSAATTTTAMAEVDIYGKVGVQLEYVDEGDGEDSEVELDNEGTKIGFEGDEAITESTDVVYQLEFGLDVTEYEDAVFVAKDTYIGLSNDNYGELLAGRITSVDDEVNFSGPTEAGGVEVAYDGERWNNSIAYFSPDYNGFVAMAQVLVEDQDNDDLTASADSYALAAKYEADMFAIGAAYVDLKDAEVDTATRVSGAVEIVENLELSALYQATDFSADNTETEQGYSIGAEYEVPDTNWELNAELVGTTDADGEAGNDMTGYAAGANYYFTDATKLQLYAGVEDWDNEDDENIKVGTGIVHKF